MQKAKIEGLYKRARKNIMKAARDTTTTTIRVEINGDLVKITSCGGYWRSTAPVSMDMWTDPFMSYEHLDLIFYNELKHINEETDRPITQNEWNQHINEYGKIPVKADE
jgi:hypothetical protein